MATREEFRALFVVFEGLDGAGTTTQSELLASHIQDMGVGVVSTREPGGTPLGERIRELVLDPGAGELGGMTELMLCAASRNHHVHTLIRPSLTLDKPVICDRYTASSVAYQGGGRGLDLAQIGLINELATGNCRADLTVFVDVPLEAANKRSKERSANADRFESEAEDFKQRVADAYRMVAAQEPERSFVVDGTESREQVFTAVLSELAKRWPAFPFKY